MDDTAPSLGAGGGPPIDAPYTLWIGRSDTTKRPEHVLALARRTPDHPFVMIMNPSDPAIDADIRARASGNVHIIDRVPFDRIDGWFQRAMMLINTSDYEGFPNTFLQGAKYGVPTVSLRVDPDGFLQQHGCGIACEGDADRFAAAHARLLADSAERSRMGEVARAYVAAHHNAADRCEQLYALLAELAPSRERKPMSVVRVCFVCGRAMALFDPGAAGAFGGMQLRASLFAKGLAARDDFEVSFAVATQEPASPQQFGDITVHALTESSFAAARRDIHWPGDVGAGGLVFRASRDGAQAAASALVHADSLPRLTPTCTARFSPALLPRMSCGCVTIEKSSPSYSWRMIMM